MCHPGYPRVFGLKPQVRSGSDPKPTEKWDPDPDCITADFRPKIV